VKLQDGSMERLDGKAKGEGDGHAPSDLDRGVRKNYGDVGNQGYNFVHRFNIYKYIYKVVSLVTVWPLPLPC
jgi:hypothetical protein